MLSSHLDDPAAEGPAGAKPGGSPHSNWVSRLGIGGRIIAGLLVLQRVLFGLMFLLTGTLWLRGDTPPGQYLLENAAQAAERGLTPVGLYAPFFESLVIPNAAVFGWLAAGGELLTGAALLLCFPGRAGAIGGMFLAANYGLAFGNGLFPPEGNFLLVILLVPLLSRVPYQFANPAAWWTKRGVRAATSDSE